MPLTIYPRGVLYYDAFDLLVKFLLHIASKNSTKRNIHGLSVSEYMSGNKVEL